MNDLRFDWYPTLSSAQLEERLAVLLEELLKDYKAGRGIKPKATYEASYRAIGIKLLSALYAAHHANEAVSVPRRPRGYGVNHLGRVNFSFKDTDAVFRKLESLGWIKVSQAGKEGSYTRIIATGDLGQAFDEWGLVWMLPELLPSSDCVELRDVKRDKEGKPLRTGKKKQTTKVDVEVPEGELVDQHRANLSYINDKLRQHCISLDLSNEHLLQLQKEMATKKTDSAEDTYRSLHFQRVQLTRIFSRGSMELGGRFYRGWWQMLPSSHRPHIRIDGKKTIEVDYSGMSLRIIYALAGQKLDADTDPYDIGLPQWEGPSDSRRKPVKKIINALINDEDGVYSIPKNVLKLLKVSDEDFRLLLAKKHPLIQKELSSGIGLKTQYIDSQVAEAVMLDFLREDVVVLPVHDSFIVPVGFKMALEASMKDHFNLLTGSDISVEAEVVKLDEHFGLSKDEVLDLEASGDESLGIVSGTDTWDVLIDNKQRITTKYLSSWDRWKVSN